MKFAIFLVCLMGLLQVQLFDCKINCLKAQTTITARSLLPAFPEHALHSVAAQVNNQYQVGVLMTDFGYQSSLYLYNTSNALANASSQLISQTTFTGQYARDLVSLNARGTDWFAAVFRDPTTMQDLIGMFQPNDTKPQITIQGGFRTTIGQNANLNCQECVVAAMMLADFSWVVKQINFINQTVIWQYNITDQKFSNIYEINMAIGLGANTYLVNILGSNLQQQEILYTIDVNNNKTLLTKILSIQNAVTSYQEFYTGYNVFANRQEIVGLMNITTGNATAQWQTTFPNDTLINCATAYPYICCGNMRYRGTFAQHNGEIQVWSYNMTKQPNITAPLYVIKEDSAVQHLTSAYYSSQFLYTTLQNLKVFDYSQLSNLFDE